jgi:hypothetical protein
MTMDRSQFGVRSLRSHEIGTVPVNWTLFDRHSKFIIHRLSRKTYGIANTVERRFFPLHESYLDTFFFHFFFFSSDQKRENYSIPKGDLHHFSFFFSRTKIHHAKLRAMNNEKKKNSFAMKRKKFKKNMNGFGHSKKKISHLYSFLFFFFRINTKSFLYLLSFAIFFLVPSFFQYKRFGFFFFDLDCSMTPIFSILKSSAD